MKISLPIVIVVTVFSFVCSCGQLRSDVNTEMFENHYMFEEDICDEDTEQWTYISATSQKEDCLSLFGRGDDYMFQYGQERINDSPVFSLWVSNSPKNRPGIFEIQKGAMSFFVLVADTKQLTGFPVATGWCLNSDSSWGCEDTVFGKCEIFATRHGEAINVCEALSANKMAVSIACLGDAQNFVQQTPQGFECHHQNESNELKKATVSEIKLCLQSEMMPLVFFEHAPLPVIIDQFVCFSNPRNLFFGTPDLTANDSDWTISIPCFSADGPRPFSLLEFSRNCFAIDTFPNVSFSKSPCPFDEFFEKLAKEAGCMYSVNYGSIKLSGKNNSGNLGTLFVEDSKLGQEFAN